MACACVGSGFTLRSLWLTMPGDYCGMAISNDSFQAISPAASSREIVSFMSFLFGSFSSMVNPLGSFVKAPILWVL